MPKVVVMYLLWDQEPKKYLEDAIAGIKSQTYSKEDTEFLIVYNSHKQENPSQASYIEEIIEKYKDELPHTTFLNQEKNWGFSGGNNLGMQWGIDHGFDYVFLHNGDGYLGQNSLKELVEKMDKDKTIGASQAMMLLHPETDRINSAGNALHYLGFGYCQYYKYKKETVVLPEVSDVGYISGGAIMLRTDLLKTHGLWDEDYFMYHEDTDYSLRLRMQNYRTVLIRDAEFFHKYQFSKSISKYYWMERNRYTILLLYYRIPTLLLLLPVLIALEIGMWFFALKGGWWKEKVKVYKYWSKGKNWKIWLGKRKGIQENRQISDRELLKNAARGIHFQEAQMEHPLVLYVGNPIMEVYYWIVVRGLIWW
jgi:GT2 family glycosyltransferase